MIEFDQFAPIRLSDDDFRFLCSEIETGIAVSEIGLRPLFGSKINPFELYSQPGASVFSTVEDSDRLEDFETAMLFLDSVMLYAFEEAPDDVIRTWAEDFDAKMADDAVARVHLAASLLLNTKRLWESKTHSRLPILGRISYEFIQSDVLVEPSALVTFEPGRYIAFRIERDSHSEVTVRMWEDDVRDLRNSLDEILARLHKLERDTDD